MNYRENELSIKCLLKHLFESTSQNAFVRTYTRSQDVDVLNLVVQMLNKLFLKSLIPGPLARGCMLIGTMQGRTTSWEQNRDLTRKVITFTYLKVLNISLCSRNVYVYFIVSA